MLLFFLLFEEYFSKIRLFGEKLFLIILFFIWFLLLFYFFEGGDHKKKEFSLKADADLAYKEQQSIIKQRETLENYRNTIEKVKLLINIEQNS